ncbi:MAG: hypothetical protein KF791_20780 [Verrucomicrobiae bacterium]|nr:hypothetical protein [Verrucomicrobiae bacterium]
MSAHAYTEDPLVEQPAMRLFEELGWTMVSALEETFGGNGTLGRETKGDVVPVPRLRVALEQLKPTLPPETIAAAMDELTGDRSAMSLPAANREICQLLNDGIRVGVADTEPSPQPSPTGRGSSGKEGSAPPLGEGFGGEGRGEVISERSVAGQRIERVRRRR